MSSSIQASVPQALLLHSLIIPSSSSSLILYPNIHPSVCCVITYSNINTSSPVTTLFNHSIPSSSSSLLHPSICYFIHIATFILQARNSSAVPTLLPQSVTLPSSSPTVPSVRGRPQWCGVSQGSGHAGGDGA